MRSLFDPQGFYFFAGKTIKPLFALAAVDQPDADACGYYARRYEQIPFFHIFDYRFIRCGPAWRNPLVRISKCRSQEAPDRC